MTHEEYDFGEMERMSRAVHKINEARYRRLLSRTMPVFIETEEENERMLAIVEKLMDKGENLSLEENKLLKLFARLIEDFEKRYYQPRDASPLEILQHLMESRDVKQTHLWELFGSKGIASEVLNGKRGISKTHARALADYFHVTADLFI
jgi:HTH-type transcriptional regulator/antitoxin HigA